MKKQEALAYIRREKGYVLYIMMFDIYEDVDIIPEELIRMSIKPDVAPGSLWYVQVD